MRTKQVLAVLLCVAMVSSGLGMISMAENNQSSEQAGVMPQKTVLNNLKSIERIATPAEPEEAPDLSEEAVPSEPEEAPDSMEAAASSEPEKLAAPLMATPLEATYVSNEEELREGVKQSGNIVLEENIQLTKPLYIPSDVNISLEGGGITYAGDSKNSKLIVVAENSKVTLENITIDATGMDCSEMINGHGRDYYALFTKEKSEIILMQGANITASDNPDELKNSWKRGMWINGTCSMEGGSISGFADIGIVVVGNFTMTGGELTGNGFGNTTDGNGTGALSVIGKNSTREGGYAYLEGGIITDNLNGVFNGGTFKMTGGEITDNQWGLVSNIQDGISNEEFFPDSILTGGSIQNNRAGAIWNKQNGSVTIEGSAEISGDQRGEVQLRTMAVRSQAQSKAVIKNEKKSILNIKGGTITSNSPDETAIFNDNTGRLIMTGGTITAAGTAIRNENATAGEVKLTSGKIQLTGTAGKAIDNLGYIEASSDLQLESENGNQYLVAVNHNEGGQVSPSASVEPAGKTIHFEIKPDAGYLISNVAVDGDSKGALSSFDLTVEHAHEVVVTFVKRQSSSSSSGSGSSSSSGSSRTAAKSSIPETPGSWVLDQTGWKYINNKVPYSNTWVRKNNAWYWIGADGYMKTGWNLIFGKWYYMSLNSGEMKTGWITDQGFWYYMDGTGARAVGWIQSGDKWYYLNPDGKMAVNTTTPDGYRVDETGAWVK